MRAIADTDLQTGGAPTPPVLSIVDASKSYDGIPVLVDASLDLLAGEVHALVGENGAGKSTLLKLLAGAVPADSIQIILNGRPVSFNSTRDAYRAGLRFIHQELNVVPQLSVAENVFLGQPYPTRARIFTHWSQLHRRASDALAQLGITHIDVRKLISRLSPGDQMLVKIASAFADESASSGGSSGAVLYVLDEPTSALTGSDTALLFRVIDRLRQRGCAILYVTHRLEEVFEIADRVTVMRDGRIVTTQPVDDVSQSELIRLMTGREMQQVYPARAASHNDQVLLDVDDLGTSLLKDISFQLFTGEILGIAGLNGSGRTELMRALMGADLDVEGQIHLADSEYRPRSPSQTWASGIGYVPEERRSQGLVLSRSISDNMLLPYLERFGVAGIWLNHKKARTISAEFGQKVRLRASSMGQVVRQLSGGNQQKVVFARATGHAPRLLLLDEPTRGVDVGAKFDIYTMIRHLAEEGTGILMASSDLPELLGLCDRILVLRRGHLVDIVAASDTNEEHLLALCFGEVSHGD